MKFDVVAEVEKKKDLLIETADYIWDHPELGFKEFQCAQKLQEVLRAEGFQLETGLGISRPPFPGVSAAAGRSSVFWANSTH